MAEPTDSEGIDLGDKGADLGEPADIFDTTENVTVGAVVPTGFPLKLSIGIAVLILALLAFIGDKK